MTQQHPLPQAIKEVFAQLGIEAMLSTKIVYAVLDFGGFAQFPATRQILRDVIVEGYAQMLYDIYQNNHKKPSLMSTVFGGGKQNTPWEPRVKQFILDFIKKTGYNDSLVDYTFQSILYGLGYLSNVAEPTIQQPKTVPFSVASNAPKSTAPSQPIAVNTPPPFTPQVETQFLVIKFKPDTATLYVDGIEQPASYGNWADELSLGKHCYKLEEINYLSKEGYITLEANKKTVLDINLTLDTNAIEVKIESGDFDVEIWVDNIKRNREYWKGYLSVGSHSLICRKPNHYDFVTSIDVSSKTKTFKIPPLKQISGAIKVDVKPYGSKIYLNSVEKGESPLILKDLKPGKYMLLVKTNEGTSCDATVDVKENEITVFSKAIQSVFLNDLSQIQVGDYLYSDGTYSRGTQATNKICIGVVATLETSEKAKRDGYYHGQIVSTQLCSGRMCTQDNVDLSCFPKYSAIEVQNMIN